jgi:type IV pilus assembly protein PilV
MRTMRTYIKKYDRQHGFSLLEILVAMIIIAIGILGVAGIQVTALKFTKGSESRMNAVQMSYDLIDRMRANKPGARGGEYAGLNAFSTTTCSATPPAASARLSDTDIDFWRNALACNLPSGVGKAVITPGATSADPVGIEVTVQWDESRLKGGSSTNEYVTRTLL